MKMSDYKLHPITIGHHLSPVPRMLDPGSLQHEQDSYQAESRWVAGESLGGGAEMTRVSGIRKASQEVQE